MREFEPGTYEIRVDPDIVMSGPFSSMQEILGYIARRLPPGVYRVDRVVPSRMPRGAMKVPWAEVTNHGGESVSYRPTPPIT